jgi:curved DNA-binding protein CbpA
VADSRPGARPGFDPYKTLQVDPEADPDVIQAAYRRLAQKFHPDVATGDEAAARMIAINAAWEILRDPARRAELDRQRAAAAASGTGRAPGQPAGPGPARRTASGASSATGAPGTAGGHQRTTDPSAAPGTSGWGPEAPGSAGTSARAAPRPPDTVSPDWTSGRSTTGGGYDPDTMRAAEGHGAAGPPPGNPSGTLLTFGRYARWSLGEIARVDVEYLEWLDRAPIGRAYRDELDALLRQLGRRRTAKPGDSEPRRGLFRR